MADQNNSAEPKKRNATERLEDLENASMSLFHLNDNLVRDVTALKEALRLLDNKVNAITKASVAGEELSDAVLSRIMIENNVDELAQKVLSLVQQGTLVAEEQVSENAFVVGKELDSEDKVINPRLQFALQALKPELRAKIVGAKPGDTLKIQENLKFLVSESYSIQQPQASAPETAPNDAAAPAEAAPSDAPVTQSEPTPAQSN